MNQYVQEQEQWSPAFAHASLAATPCRRLFLPVRADTRMLPSPRLLKLLCARRTLGISYGTGVRIATCSSGAGNCRGQPQEFTKSS